MGYLTKAGIDSIDDRRTEDYEVPEWGGTVKLRVMSGKEADAFDVAMNDPEKRKDSGLRAKLVGMCLVGEDGKRLYSDGELHILAKKNGAVLARLFRKCVDLNKMSDEANEEVVEDFDETPESSSDTE